MKQISIFIIGLAAAFATIPAAAEDLTAGKSAAELFRSDCGACHRSPNGLVKDRDVGALANFLREHYTTKAETAGALAAYVAGLSSGPVPRSRAGAAADGDSDARRARDNGDAPRPPGRVGSTSSKPNAQPHSSRAREADDPVSRLRSYLSTGLDSNGAQEGKTGAPKARKRRNSTVDVQGAKSNADKLNADTPPSVRTAVPPPADTAPPAGGSPAEAPAPAAAPAEEAPAAPQ